jgi:nucleotide-binding universal stress UspA family protein
MSDRPLPTTIFHPTSLKAEDYSAFAHATALAAASGARLVSFHAAPDGGEQDIPDANLTLAAWGSSATVVQQRLTRLYCDDIMESLLFAVHKAQPDLIVATTHLRPDWQRWMREGVAETIAHLTHIPMLYLPAGGRGLLDIASGVFHLAHIVIAAESPEIAMQAARWAAWLVQIVGGAGTITVLHIGQPQDMRSTLLPELPGWRWELHTQAPRKLSLEEQIVRVVERERNCLLIMPTRSRNSLADALLGTHTERVLHRLHTPLLSVPIDEA